MNVKRMLVVDDDPDVCTFIRKVGEGGGFQVLTAANAATFKQSYKSFQPSLIVLDLVIPGTDGVELLRFLAQEQSKSAILVVSGAEKRVVLTTERLGEAQGLKMIGHLEKPIRIEKLREIIERVSEQFQAISTDELRRAIREDELVLHYQPKVDLLTRKPVGCEALVRWNHPKHGLLGPDRFVPLAEQSGLIEGVTEWVLAAALAQTRRWLDLGFDLTMAVNVAAPTLYDLRFPDFVGVALSKANVPGPNLQLEFTESQTIGDVVQTMDTVSRLRLKQVELAIDDFGTGYSSLKQLQRMPVSEIKIDKSFVMSAPTSADAMVIVRAIVDLGHNLGLKVVAEGVETEEVWRLLVAEGCDLAQGYYISRPVTADKFESWHAAWTAPG
jgi:EAL domain-containing protein (putative c-di-GMP-specific phosphodiesterase class I)/ActR/RegA family two-component response regulator